MGCCISRNKEEVENNPKETQNSPMRSNSCDLPRNPEEQASEKYIIKYSYNRQTNKRKSSSIFEKNSKLLSTSHTSDDNYFDYDSEAFKSVNIHNVPEINSNSILNSTRDGFKIPNPPLFNDNSVVVPRFDESDFESANENILEVAKNDKILNDITLLNDLQETKNNYVSFSSNSILSQYLTPKEENNNNFIDLNGFSNMKYDFFYIEFHYFLLWNKEYLKGIYPDLNFILTIEINDDKSSLEKIILVRNGDDRYFPQRSSLNSEAFVRIMRVLNKETPFDNSEYNTHKLRFTIVNNTNNRLIPVCVEDVFISEKKLYEGMKIKFNQNLNMVYSSKKVGYILFNFAYRSEELNKNDLNEEKEKIFKYFSSLENTTKFVEEPLLIYRYHYVQNYYIKKNGSEQNRFKNNFTSIGDIQDTDFGGELSNEGIPLNRLLELFDLSKQAYDFYVILKKLSDYMSNSEFTEEKSLKLKEKIFNKLKEILEIKNNDIFLISLIFQILKKLFFKSKKENKSKFSKSSTPKSEVEIKQKMIEAARVQDINLGLMKSFLEISFDFLLEKSLPEEIPTASLNYIFKHFEEIIQNFFFDGKRKLSSDEFFCNYILINKRYEILAELLVRYPDNPSCVQTVLHVLNKTIKFRKEDCKEIINYFLFNINYEVITNKIIKTHDCNSFIMTSLMCFKYYIVDIYKRDIDLVFSGINFSKFREIFGTFRSNGFEQIHETIFYIIRNILSKREKESSQGEAISDDEFKEVIMILALALELIKGKIQLCKDFYKLASLLMNLLNYVYMICYIINGFPIKRKKICIEKKISELVIDCLAALNERKVFVSLDNAFKRYEIISLNSKTMVFRTLFHCIQLIKSLKENFPSTLTKPYAEKIYKVIKSIGDTDSVYNPEGIGKDIDKFCKKEDKMITTAHNNLKDYYSRYKKQEHEYVGEFLTICRS